MNAANLRVGGPLGGGRRRQNIGETVFILFFMVGLYFLGPRFPQNLFLAVLAVTPELFLVYF